uniref:Uncharacterized protein n=1 Tax=Sphaerodactylus townsendi TaxID=933632 RepID=A0ACB8EZ94_9SAUR
MATGRSWLPLLLLWPLLLLAARPADSRGSLRIRAARPQDRGWALLQARGPEDAPPAEKARSRRSAPQPEPMKVYGQGKLFLVDDEFEPSSSVASVWVCGVLHGVE